MSKRAMLVYRLRFLGTKRRALLVAATRYMDPAFQGEWDKNDRATDVETAAVEYAAVAFRYLGGDR